MPKYERESLTVTALCRAWEFVHGAEIQWHWDEKEQVAQGFEKPCEQLVYRNGELLAIEHTEVAYFPDQQWQHRKLDEVRTAVLAELKNRRPGVLFDEWFPYPPREPFLTRDDALLAFANAYARRVVVWMESKEPDSFEELVPGTEMVLRTYLTAHTRRIQLGFVRTHDVSGLTNLVAKAVKNKEKKLRYLKGKGLRTVLLLDTHPMGHSGWFTDYANAYHQAISQNGGIDEMRVVDELYLACDLYEGIPIAIPLKVDGDTERLQDQYWQIQRDKCTP